MTNQLGYIIDILKARIATESYAVEKNEKFIYLDDNTDINEKGKKRFN